jgi:peptidoglycan/xylan/chitin deacetylase (PgdA/CDA1 family)
LPPSSPLGLSAPSKVEEIWLGEFEYMRRHVPNGVFTLTMHPQVIGRGHRLLLLERLIERFKEDGARLSRLDEAAEGFRRR